MIRLRRNGWRLSRFDPQREALEKELAGVRAALERECEMYAVLCRAVLPLGDATHRWRHVREFSPETYGEADVTAAVAALDEAAVPAELAIGRALMWRDSVRRVA